MVDTSVMHRLEELHGNYKETWGKEVDYGVVPKGITQEKLIACLELMVEDNVSLLSAYNHLFNK